MKSSSDITATATGACAGYLLLSRADWSKVFGGETTLILVALLLIALGYAMYRGDPPTPQGRELPPVNEQKPDTVSKEKLP